jgi:transportin-3
MTDKINLITTFVQKVQPQVEPPAPNPAVKYCQEILPILSELASNFQDFVPILERVCRCWRYMVLSYRTSAAPMLPDLAAKLVAGFQGTKQGCFLWATDSIVREFSEHQLDDDVAYPLDPSIVANMVPFWEQQASVFLNALSGVEGEQLPDLIEDFFRLCMDMLLHHTIGTIRSQFLGPVLAAAVHSLSLLKTEVLMVTLHFLRDFISYGLPDSPSSQLSNTDRDGEKSGAKTPTDIQSRIKSLLSAQGQTMTARVLTGMMYSFPGDCIADASGVVLDMLKVLPHETARWIGETLLQLPAGHIRPHERERLVAQIDQ